MDALKKALRFYENNKKQFLPQYEGRVLVIKDGRVLGDYETTKQAVDETLSQGHKLGSFLAHKVQKEEEPIVLSRTEM